MRKLLIVNQSSGYLMRDIADSMLKRYDEVVIMAGEYYYNNIKCDKIVKYNNSNIFNRLLTWLVAFVQIVIKIRCSYKGYDILLVSNPPLCSFVPLFFNNTYSFLVYDLYPDVLINEKFINKYSIIAKLWKNVNQRTFSGATAVFCLSSGMKNAISAYCSIHKIFVVPLWADDSGIEIIERSKNLFIKEMHLEDKFIVEYSGNLGNTHRVDVLLDVAKLLVNEPVEFLIIGDGARKKEIEDRQKKECLNNIKILPYQPSSYLSHSLGAADIAVITLDVNASNMSVPSKSFNMMKLGKPLLCIASEDSELGRIVSKYNLGAVFPPNDVEAIANFIRQLLNDRDKKELLIRNSINALSDFSKNNAELIYISKK